MNDLYYKKKGKYEKIGEIRPESINTTDIGKKNNLSFMNTHICTSGNECPAKQGNIRGENPCNFCKYAIRTGDHLRL